MKSEPYCVGNLSASTAVGADRIVWKWTDGDSHVRRVTNAFTVLSVRLFGDIDLDGGWDPNSEWAEKQCVDAEEK